MVYVTPITDNAIPVVWENAETMDVPATDLEKSPRSSAQFSTFTFHRQSGKELLGLGKGLRHVAVWLAAPRPAAKPKFESQL